MVKQKETILQRVVVAGDRELGVVLGRQEGVKGRQGSRRGGEGEDREVGVKRSIGRR